MSITVAWQETHQPQTFELRTRTVKIVLPIENLTLTYLIKL